MKYVVKGIVDGIESVGDIPTSKSHATRWAHRNQEIYGGEWFAIPAPAESEETTND